MLATVLLPSSTAKPYRPGIGDAPVAEDESTEIATAGRRPYLHELLATLWPAPATISYPTRFARVIGAATDYVVMPALNNPKLVLPRRPRKATAGAIRNYQASAVGRAMLKVRVVSLAARLGLSDALPGRVSIQTCGDGIDDHLRVVLGRDTVIALYVGPARAVQKPVLQLLTTRGETFAFAKLGTNPLTRELVRNEVVAMEMIRAAGLSSLSVPEVIHHGQWRGHELIVQSAIPPNGSEALVLELLPQATRQLGSVAGRAVRPWRDSSYRQRLAQRLGALTDEVIATASVVNAIRRIETAAGGADLEFGSWHGDWARWNMTAIGNKLIAWDWEHFQSDVPFGFDAAHFDISQLVVFEGLSPQVAFARLVSDTASGLLPRLLGDRGVRCLVACLYLVEIATRYIEDDEVGVAGTPMSRLDDWLDAALSVCLDALERSFGSRV